LRNILKETRHARDNSLKYYSEEGKVPKKEI
jgi:hypothetical protein